MLTLHILTASGRLNTFADLITEAHRKGVSLIEKVLPLAEVDIVVSDNPNAAIPEIGVGGYSPNAHRLDIYIDPGFPNLGLELESKLMRTLAHELHHCARWSSCGYGNTLFEAVISEGLADHFDQEVNGKDPLPWSTALTKDQIQFLKPKLFEEAWKDNYDHSAWFFGTQPHQIPRWAGYTLGYDLTKKYMELAGKKPSELVFEPAKSFYNHFKEHIKRP